MPWGIRLVTVRLRAAAQTRLCICPKWLDSCRSNAADLLCLGCLVAMLFHVASPTSTLLSRNPKNSTCGCLLSVFLPTSSICFALVITASRRCFTRGSNPPCRRSSSCLSRSAVKFVNMAHTLWDDCSNTGGP
eukprot:361255-Chlamydomonas_euryale.AAC.3